MPIIGREPPADIVIPAPQVSARHAEITALGNGMYQLVDLGSTNGTSVNGQRIQSATVGLHDRVSLGTFQINLGAYARVLEQKDEGAWRQPVRTVPPAQSAGPAAVQLASQPPQHHAVVGTSPPQAAKPVVKSAPQPQARLGNEMAVALATQKSFVGKAFACWFLYWLFYIPGLVMNLAWLSEAKKVRALTGQAPSGMGCLQFLLFKFVFLPILVLILFLVTGGAFLTALMNMF